MTVKFDASAIVSHVALLHRLARQSGQDGILVLAAYGQSPDSGESIIPSVQHFGIGDIQGMTLAALAYENVPHANVYMPLALMRSDLTPGAKGRAEDVMAVLGAIIDDDADKNTDIRPPVEAPYILESSSNPAPNRQHFFLFDRALSPSEAKPLLEALHRGSGGDAGTKDITHVWRVPGTANWPNSKKVHERGRPREPQPVRVIKPWGGGLTSVDELRQVLQPHWVAPRIEHASGPKKSGTCDIGDVSKVLTWMAERDAFADYDSWCQVGMILRSEFGDEGFDLWRITHDSTVSDGVEDSKWQSFTSGEKALGLSIGTLIDRASKMQCPHHIRPSIDAMFGGVVESGVLSASSSASLFGGRGQKQAEIWAPILALVPRVARMADHPLMPDTGHPLREAINEAIPGIIANGSVEALAVVEAVHRETATATSSLTRGIDISAVKARSEGLVGDVERALASHNDYIRDVKGLIEPNNVDNVRFFLRSLGCECRWNGWTEQAEVRGWKWSKWATLDDTMVAQMRTRAGQTGTRFLPSKEFLWDAMTALVHESPVDPALDMLRDLQAKWDGIGRLDTWLSQCCGVPSDPYHQAVSRNIIGGIVRRCRKPGGKQDVMPVFYGPQGTLKSTLARMLALRNEWFSDEVLLGDASKELVLSLAGVLVVEVAEMGMRGSANPAHVKAMLSRQVDRGRTAYARTVTARPRRNIFIGTTNDPKHLRDQTGNRRFLPISVANRINIEWLHENVAQIFGEAATREAAGEDFDLPPSVWADAAAAQDAVTERPGYEIHLHEWFAETPLAVFVTAADLADFVKSAAGKSVPASEYAKVLRELKFDDKTKRVDGKPAAVWFRGDLATATRITPRLVEGRIQPRIVQSIESPPLVPAAPQGATLPSFPAK